MLGFKKLIQKYSLFRFCKIKYLKYEGKNDFLEINEISSFAMGLKKTFPSIFLISLFR